MCTPTKLMSKPSSKLLASGKTDGETAQNAQQSERFAHWELFDDVTKSYLGPCKKFDL